MSTRTLDETSFPLYTIQAINDELFIVCGGGGAAKTGVKNAIKVYKLSVERGAYTAELVHEQGCGLRAPMNLHVNHDRNTVAIGMDHLTQLYGMHKKDDKIKFTEQKSFETTEGAQNEDDDGSYQTAVRFTPDNSKIITADSNGDCKIFKYPSLEELCSLKKAHGFDIDDLDVHPNSKYFVTVSKEHSALLWTTEGKKHLELPFCVHKKDEDLFRFRNCRFSKNLDNDKIYLYSTHIPRKARKDSPPCCLVKWDTHKWIPEKTVQVKGHTLSALAASSNGRYVGMGTAAGSILVYISWNMTHMKTIDGVHDTFLTSLSFLPDNKVLIEDLCQDLALLSCSIDNRCQITTLPRRTEIPMWMVITIMVLLLFATFNLIAYVDIDF